MYVGSVSWLHLKTSINVSHTFEWVWRTCTDSHYCARYVLLFTQALDSHKVFLQVTVKYKVNKVHQSTNKLIPISLVTSFHLLTWWFWSCFILFVFQGYPASLRLLVHAEGEKLTLLLEKNEWVFAWFIYPSSADSVNVYVNDGQQINGPQLRLDGVVYPRGCEVVWVRGYDIVYSRREKIICPSVIELFYASLSPKAREMKADKD